jgi:molybdopterin-guanine dinucleotide biosynthesis protein A
MIGPNPPQGVLGVLLAGGRSRRMGQDKAWTLLAGRPLIGHARARLEPQVAALAISANGDPAPFAALGLPVLPDPAPDHPGPLAGILAGMRHAQTQEPALDWVATAPVDAPFVPSDLVARLAEAMRGSGAPVGVARSAGKRHPVCALWSAALADRLDQVLAGGLRRVDLWAREQGCVLVDWPAEPTDPFLNLNTPEDLAQAARLL